MDEPDKILQVLNKIQNGVNFFKAHFEYKKADIYLRRFESLKVRALEIINLKVMSILREVNKENNI